MALKHCQRGQIPEGDSRSTDKDLIELEKNKYSNGTSCSAKQDGIGWKLGSASVVHHQLSHKSHNDLDFPRLRPTMCLTHIDACAPTGSRSQFLKFSSPLASRIAGSHADRCNSRTPSKAKILVPMSTDRIIPQ